METVPASGTEGPWSTHWNVRLPSPIEQEVLAALDSPEADRRLDSIARRFPEMRQDISVWARQARGFGTFRTLAPATSRVEEMPAQVGRYRILSPLGSGGFGQVLLGEDSDTGQKYAIKVLRKQDRRSAELIQHEFQILASLDHPAVVEVHEYGLTEAERPYYSMDYVSGLAIDAVFRAELQSNNDLVASLLQLSDSLSYVHHKHLIHRDIKPQNVLVDDEGHHLRVHLVDFGIATLQVEPGVRSGTLQMVKGGQLLQQTVFTQDGAIVGTPGFMAPEQFISTATAQSDIYSLGVTTYLLLTGRFPVEPEHIVRAWKNSPSAAFDTIVSSRVVDPTTMARAQARRSGPVKPAHIASARLTSGLSSRQQRMLNAALLRSLQSDPSLRHNDAAELGDELAAAFGLLGRPFRLFTHVANGIRKVAAWIRKPPRPDDPRHARVWFVTDRTPRPHARIGHHFSTRESDELSFGYSIVRRPRWQVIGRIKARIWDRITGDAGYDLLGNRVLTRSEFESALRRSERKGLLLFIHGYNTSFEDAILRAAQLQSDLKMTEQVICYSWPSQGRAWRYGNDAALCEESEDCFSDALDLLTATCSAHELHVLAHSMGNRLVLSACHAKAVLGGSPLPLGQVILAAPDVAQRRFRQRCAAFSGATRRTIYSSKHDRALMGSRFLHARGRAGYIPPVLIVSDVDTIDASVHGLSLWGLNHSAFGNARALVTDISTLIRQDLAPELRIGLDRRIDPESGKPYWVCLP